jgi:hypothetical protein
MSNQLVEYCLEGKFQELKEQVQADKKLIKKVDEDGRLLIHWAGKLITFVKN